jgi:hypothetical protein
VRGKEKRKRRKMPMQKRVFGERKRKKVERPIGGKGSSQGITRLRQWRAVAGAIYVVPGKRNNLISVDEKCQFRMINWSLK